MSNQISNQLKAGASAVLATAGFIPAA